MFKVKVFQKKKNTGAPTDEKVKPVANAPQCGSANDNSNSKGSNPVSKKIQYKPAPISLLNKANNRRLIDDATLKQQAIKLEETISSLGVNARIVGIAVGPAFTRFEISIPAGTRINQITAMQNDIQLAMATASINIEAPIPGKSTIGIDLSNSTIATVDIRGLMGKDFMESSPLTVALGRDIIGKPIYCDLAEMPHLLIAGATGSGKSVCINAILISILCKATPEQVRFLLIDAKGVELNEYNDIPHLVSPVVLDNDKALGAIKWLVLESQRRMRMFSEARVQSIEGYNESIIKSAFLPRILVVINELSMMINKVDEKTLSDIKQVLVTGRDVGIHMIISTQHIHPHVITNEIKRSIPSRISFAVSSEKESSLVLDMTGAEKLAGNGDMLYAPISAHKPIRGLCSFVSDLEVQEVVNYFKKMYGFSYVLNEIPNVVSSTDGLSDDPLFDNAVEVVLEQGRASVSILQRHLCVGYPRAGKLIDELEMRGIIGGFEGSKPRRVLITRTDWLEMKARR